MTKRKGTLPARKRHDRSRDDESLLLRSAESLGRVIGALQRQVNGATKRLSDAASEASEPIHSLPESRQATRRGTKKRNTTRKRAGAKKAKKAAPGVTRSAARKKTKKR